MDEETLQPDTPPAPFVDHSNVKLRAPEAQDIPASLQRELQRDQPKSRQRRGELSGRDSRRSKPIGWKLPAIVTAVLMGGLMAWAFWPTPSFDDTARQQWVELCEDYEQWYVPFAKSIDDNDMIVLRQVGLINAQANIGIHNFDPRYIGKVRDVPYADLAASPPRAVRDKAGVDKIRAASASIDRLVEAFDEWPVHVKLRKNLDVITAHGWERAAKRVREVLADAPPRGQGALGESLHRMIAAEVRTSVIANAASQLDKDLAVLERVNDPVLHHFRDAVAALTDDALPAGRNDDEYLENLGDALRPLAAFGERFRTTLQSDGWKNIDYDGLRAEGEAYALLKDPALDSEDVFRQWLDEVQRYFALSYDWRVTWALETRHGLQLALDQALSLVQSDRPEDAESLRAWSAKIETRIDTLCEPVLTARISERLTLDRFAIEGEVADLTSSLGNLAARATASDAVASILEDRPLAAEPYRSRVVDARWRSELGVLGERLRRNNDPEAMERDALALRTRLYALVEPGGTRSMPPVPIFGGNHDANRSPEASALRLALTDHCRQAREGALTDLLAGALPVDPGNWDRLRSSYLDILDAAERLNDLAVDIDRMFREARLPDDPALRRGGRSLADRIDMVGGPLLEDPALAGSAQPVLTRADAVVMAYRTGEINTELAAATEPMTALAAWTAEQNNPSSSAASPDFETSLERLNAADQLDLLIGRIGDSAQQAHWQNRIDQVRRGDWAMLAAAASSPQQIATVLSAADHLGMSPDAMPPRMRFNALLANLREAADDGSASSPAQRDAALMQQARAFSRGAASFRDDPDAGPWVERLAALTVDDPDAAQQFEAVGPVQAGWKLVALDDAGTATFAKGDDRMRFARLETSTGSLYLAQSELPVATVIAAARDAKAGRDLAALLGAAAGDDLRKGPRAWVYEARADDGLTPLMPNAGAWRVGDDRSTDGPSQRTPFNYVSAESAVYVAGLLGCRLPTAAEWREAAALQNAPMGEPNLRDRAWGDFAKGIASRIKKGERGLDWADSDRLLTGASITSAALEYEDKSDGVVWLRPVPEAGVVRGLADLYGNVAELVTRSPLDPAPLIDSSKGGILARLKTFRSAHKNDYAVLGGSALSAPGESLDQPQSYNVFTGSRGFADVGIRLAFTAPDFSPVQRVRVMLEDPPVLKPASVTREISARP